MMLQMSQEQRDEHAARRKVRLCTMSYEDAAHAMQSGVAVEMQHDTNATSSKHLRVGVNSSMVTDMAVARLLIDKGIFTHDEYTEAVRIAMIDEVQRYELMLYQLFGQLPTLM